MIIKRTQHALKHTTIMVKSLTVGQNKQKHTHKTNTLVPFPSDPQLLVMSFKFQVLQSWFFFWVLQSWFFCWVGVCQSWFFFWDHQDWVEGSTIFESVRKVFFFLNPLSRSLPTVPAHHTYLQLDPFLFLKKQSFFICSACGNVRHTENGHESSSSLLW